MPTLSLGNRGMRYSVADVAPQCSDAPGTSALAGHHGTGDLIGRVLGRQRVVEEGSLLHPSSPPLDQPKKRNHKADTTDNPNQRFAVHSPSPIGFYCYRIEFAMRRTSRESTARTWPVLLRFVMPPIKTSLPTPPLIVTLFAAAIAAGSRTTLDWHILLVLAL